LLIKIDEAKVWAKFRQKKQNLLIVAISMLSVQFLGLSDYNDKPNSINHYFDLRLIPHIGIANATQNRTHNQTFFKK